MCDGNEQLVIRRVVHVQGGFIVLRIRTIIVVIFFSRSE